MNIHTRLLILGTVFVMVAGISLVYVFNKNDQQESNPLKIGYSGQSLNYGSVMVAYEAGFFDAHAVPIEMMPLKSGSQTKLALATGKIDVAFLNITDLLTAIDAGAPIKVLFPTAEAATIIFVRPDNAIQTFNDLRGKKILGESGASRYELIHALAKENITPSDIIFVSLEKEYREIALMNQKAIDVIPTSRYKEDSLRRAGAVPLREWEEKGYNDEFSPHTYLAVNSDYMLNHSDEVEKVVDAIIDAQEFIAKNPEESATLIVKHVEGVTGGVAVFTVSDVLKSLRDSVRYLVWSDPSEVVDIADFLLSSNELKRRLSSDQIFDFRFIEKLQSAQERIYEQKN